MRLYLPALHQPGKMIEGTIPGGLGRVRETTPRQLAHVQMVAQAFAAISFAFTGFVGAVAVLQVFFFVTLHHPSFNAENSKSEYQNSKQESKSQRPKNQTNPASLPTSICFVI
jgi:hypothetical protein